MDIVRNGIILIVYLFIIIVLFIILSGPFDDIMTSFEDINSTASDSRIEDSSSYNKLVFDMVFVMLALIPIIWFIVWCFSREPEWGRRYR